MSYDIHQVLEFPIMIFGSQYSTTTVSRIIVHISTNSTACHPTLAGGHGTVTFLGSGEVSYISNPLSDDVLPIETPTAIRTVRHISPNPFYYDLNGKRVDTPHKGVVIRNGKKYINKR